MRAVSGIARRSWDDRRTRPAAGEGPCVRLRASRGGPGTTGAAALQRAFRGHFGRAAAALIRALGDWDLAEEAVQDAFATALVAWPRDGEPRDPAAWIVAVARRRAIDRLRRDRRLRALHLTPPEQEAGVVTSIPDERLRL